MLRVLGGGATTGRAFAAPGGSGGGAAAKYWRAADRSRTEQTGSAAGNGAAGVEPHGERDGLAGRLEHAAGESDRGSADVRGRIAAGIALKFSRVLARV